jgi:hypothetical protein
MPSQQDQIFLPILKVAKTAHNETHQICLFISVEETTGKAFSL